MVVLFLQSSGNTYRANVLSCPYNKKRELTLAVYVLVMTLQGW